MSDRTKHPYRTNKAGVALHIQKQLLQDIQDAGGIGDGQTLPFKLSKLCDKRSDVYGKPGSKQRVKIRNKVYTWQQKSQQEYFDILSSFGIQTPGVGRQTPVLNSSPLRPLHSPQSSFCEEMSWTSPPPTPPRSTPGRESIRHAVFQSPKGIHYDDDGNGKLESHLVLFLSLLPSSHFRWVYYLPSPCYQCGCQLPGTKP